MWEIVLFNTTVGVRGRIWCCRMDFGLPSSDSGIERGPRAISPYRDESGVSSWSSGLEDPRLDEPVLVQVAAPANPAPAANPEVKKIIVLSISLLFLYFYDTSLSPIMFFQGGDSPDHVPESPLQDPQSPASNQEREVRISLFNSVLFSLFSFHILKYTFIFYNALCRVRMLR